MVTPAVHLVRRDPCGMPEPQPPAGRIDELARVVQQSQAPSATRHGTPARQDRPSADVCQIRRRSTRISTAAVVVRGAHTCDDGRPGALPAATATRAGKAVVSSAGSRAASHISLRSSRSVSSQTEPP